MQGKASWVSRIVAAWLVLAMLLPLAGATELLPEGYSLQDSTLSGLSASSGVWVSPLTSGVYHYTLLLNKQETAFALTVVPNENREGYRPTITFDGIAPQQYNSAGAVSKEYALALGERKSIAVTVAPKDGTARTYTVVVYRTDTNASFCGEVTKQSDGSNQLALALNLPEGKQISALGLALKFDPKQLQLSSRSTNGILTGTIPGQGVSFANGFQGSAGVMKGLVARLDNTAGLVVLQFGQKNAEEGAGVQYFTVPQGGMILTLYFRVNEGAVLNEAALGLSSQANGIPNGMFFDVGASDGSQVVVSWPEPAAISGLSYALRPPVALPGGSILVSPEREAYTYGEKVAITAQPDAGYAFSGWQNGTLTDSLRSKATIYVQMTEDKDLSALTAQFKQLDEMLPSGRGLNYSSPLLGQTLMVIAPPGQGEQSITGSFGDYDALAPEAGSLAGQETPLLSDGLHVSDILPDGTLAAELHDAQLDDTGARMSALLAEAPGQGDTRMFQMRNAAKGQTLAEGWSAGNFELKEVRTAKEYGNIYLWACTDANRKPEEFTQAQYSELADNFLESYTFLCENYATVTDTDGNGGLNILLYDIEDPGGATLLGFVNSNELFGLLGSDRYPMGNSGDVLHLDGLVGMETIKSTMAHETQHLSMASACGNNAKLGKVPVWINEGLSLAVEHGLFGKQDNRISYYNNSPRIAQGYSLTQWSNQAGESLNNYALSYLFFQYLRTQSSHPNATETFYEHVGGGLDEAALDVIMTELLGCSFNQAVTRFYQALFLKEQSGVYGFQGEADFDDVQPQLLAALPTSALPECSAVYIESPGSFTPTECGSLHLAGVSECVYHLTVTTSGAGTVTTQPERVSFYSGEAVTLSAEAADGWKFSGWSRDASGGEATLTLVMDGNKAVQAQFQEIAQIRPEELFAQAGIVEIDEAANTIVQQIPGQGRITLTPVDGSRIGGDGILPEGTRVKLTAEVEPGKMFVRWQVSTRGGAERDAVLRMERATLEETLKQGVSYTAIFQDAAPPGSADVALANLRLTLPVERSIIQSVSGKGGFESGVLEYELYLRSTEATVVLAAVKKSLTEAELTQWRAGAQIGGATPITDQITGVDGNDLLQEQTYTEITLNNLLDGDQLKIRVTEEGGVGPGQTDYLINIHRSTAERDPELQAAFQKCPDDTGRSAGQAKLSMKAQNTRLHAAEMTLKLPTDLVYPVDAEGKRLPYGDLSAYGEVAAGSEYTSISIQYKSNGDGTDSVTFVVAREAANESVAPPVLPLSTLVSLYLFVDESAKIADLSGEAILYDDALMTLHLPPKILDQRFGARVYGSFFARETWTVPGVVLEKDGTLIATATVAKTTDLLPGTANMWRYTYELEGVPQESGYLLRMSGGAYLRCELLGIAVGAADLNLDQLLADEGIQRPVLRVGDLNGDNRIDFMDKQLLTGADVYGAVLPVNATGMLKNCDMDKNGRVDALDLNILTGKDNYTVKEQVIDLSKIVTQSRLKEGAAQ